MRRKGEKVALPAAPVGGGVDAVAGWAQEAAQGLVGTASERAQRLRSALEALGRTRSAAQDAEALLEALRQRGEDAPRGDGAEPPEPDGAGEIALALWQWYEVARLAWAIGSAPDAAVDGLAAQVKHLVGALRARPTRAAEEVRRRLRLPKDAREAVREAERVSERLAAERLDEGRLEEARRSLVGFGRWIQAGFLSPPHIQIIARALEDVEAGRCRRLIVMLPPRSGKSNLVSYLFAAWYAGKHPDRDVMLASHAQEKAEEWGRAIRNAVSSEEFARVFPGVRVSGDSSAAARFNLEAGEEWVGADGRRGGPRMRRGVVKSYGRKAGPTGSGANLLIVDDLTTEAEADSDAAKREAHRAVRALRSRLAPQSEGAAWVIVNTRYREDDTIGMVLTEYADDGPWTVIRLPSLAEEDEEHVLPDGTVWRRRAGDPLWPERYTREEVEVIRATLLRTSPADWYGQHMCTPVPASGAMVDLGWLRRYGAGAEFTTHDGRRVASIPLEQAVQRASRTVVTVDTSKGTGQNAARTAVQVWLDVVGHGLHDGAYLAEAWAEAVGYSAQEAKVKEVCGRWRPHALLIEDKSTGEVMCQRLPQERDWVRTPVVPVHPCGDKVTRMAGVTPTIRDGQVWVPLAAPWLHEFERELQFFPVGKHKDQPDAMSQFLNWRRVNPPTGAGLSLPPASPALKAAFAGSWPAPAAVGGRVKGW